MSFTLQIENIDNLALGLGLGEVRVTRRELPNLSAVYHPEIPNIMLRMMGGLYRCKNHKIHDVLMDPLKFSSEY